METTNVTMIVAENLTKRFDNEALALDAINFRVNEGEVYCLIGASGAGKTTVIDLFLDFIKPTSGRALINGVEVAENPLEAKKYVSYYSEDVALYNHFTARENLDFKTLRERRRHDHVGRGGSPGGGRNRCRNAARI